MTKNVATQSHTDSPEETAYTACLQSLLDIARSRAIRPGLENCHRLIALLPQVCEHAPLVVHIAGTNGKGSVAVKVATALQQLYTTTNDDQSTPRTQQDRTAYRVGRYTSPHLHSIRERITVNDTHISRSEFTRIHMHLIRLCTQHRIDATFFELTTVGAMMHFAQQQCQTLVVECGMGGRQDATNARRRAADVCVLTTVALEHTQWLGDTIQAITREKCGIVRDGTQALVTGPTVDASIVESIVQPLGVPQVHVSTPAQQGFASTDDENNAIARTALMQLIQTKRWREQVPPMCELTQEMISIGCRARLEARFEVWTLECNASQKVSPTIQSLVSHVDLHSAIEPKSDTAHCIFDVSHNAEAIQRLMQQCAIVFPRACHPHCATDQVTSTTAAAAPVSKQGRLHVIVGLSADKSLAQVLACLARHADTLWLVCARDTPRAATVEQLETIVDESQLRSLHPHCKITSLTPQHSLGNVTATVQRVMRQHVSQHDVICVTGSFYLQSEAKQAFGIAIESDPIQVSEQSMFTEPTLTGSG